jgi:hypothetical protein
MKLSGVFAAHVTYGPVQKRQRTQIRTVRRVSDCTDNFTRLTQSIASTLDLTAFARIEAIRQHECRQYDGYGERNVSKGKENGLCDHHSICPEETQY